MQSGKILCTSCGNWNVGLTGSAEGDGSVLLRDVRSAENDRIDIGPFNYVWGGGLVRTSTTLLGGMPGAGKSTMLLQMCDILAEEIEGESMYLASEEDLPAIKLRADRLGISQGHRIRMIPAMSGIGNIGALLEKYQPKAVILDSLQGLFGKDVDDCNNALDVLKKFAVVLNAPVIIVSQVTKDGDYAGQMSYQHHVDALMFLSAEESEDKEEEADRVLWVKKNRYGRAFIQSVFGMTETGLTLLEE